MKTHILLILLILPITLFSKEARFNTDLYIAKGACSSNYECCSYRDWYSKKEVSIYEKPSDNSKITNKISKGTKVIAITGEVRLKPAKFIFTKTHWHGYKPNDIIWILDGGSEGEYNVWSGKKFDRVVYFGPNYKLSEENCSNKWKSIGCSGDLVEPLQSTWWVNIKLNNGQTGWTNRPDDFSNIDACG